MRRIAMLPTGDWAEITHDNPTYVYGMNDEEFREFVENGARTRQERTMGYTSIPEDLPARRDRR